MTPRLRVYSLFFQVQDRNLTITPPLPEYSFGVGFALGW